MSDTHIEHNNYELGEPLRNPKKKGAVFIVVAVSVGVHVLGLGIFGVIKIVETIAPPPEFEAPPVVEMDKPPPPPPPPPTTKRTQKSLPRPQPLAAKNPQNMSVPSVVLQDSDVSFGRGMGGGFGELGGGILDRIDISFFGIEGGNRVAVLLDRTGSGMTIFNRTREELNKTIDAMSSNPDARLAVIYFGGMEGGHQGISKNGSDPTKHDYWYPRGVRSRTWLRPSLGEATGLQRELADVTTKKRPTRDPSERKSGKADFVLGTNFFGALEEVYKLDPPPETVYIMVEPLIAFTNEKVVRQAYASWKKFGVEKPEETELIFVVGKPAAQVKDKKAVNLMMNLLSGGGLSPKQIQDAIVYD